MAFSRRVINEMYERALACLDAEFADLPANSGGGEAAVGLRATVTEIKQESAAQAGAGDTAKVGTGQRSTARFNLKRWRNSLARTADVIARKKPGFDKDFPLPYGENDDELLTKSRAVAPKAVAGQADFTNRGLEADYVQSGSDLIEAFEAAFGVTNEALSHRGAATGGKSSAYKRADEHFDELDIYIRNKYAAQPDKINAWRNATHIERTAAAKEKENENKDE